MVSSTLLLFFRSIFTYTGVVIVLPGIHCLWQSFQLHEMAADHNSWGLYLASLNFVESDSRMSYIEGYHISCFTLYSSFIMTIGKLPILMSVVTLYYLHSRFCLISWLASAFLPLTMGFLSLPTIFSLTINFHLTGYFWALEPLSPLIAGDLSPPT